MGKIRATFDSWKNALTGLGGSKDKRRASLFERDCLLTDPVLEDLYHNNDLAATICDTFPEESLREGFEIKIEDTEEKPTDSAAKPEDPTFKKDSADTIALKSKILNRCDELCVTQRVLDGAVWGNVFGAGAILLGVDDGPVNKPLTFKPGKEIKFLTVLDKRDLVPKTLYADPFAPKYATPETYAFVNSISNSAGIAPRSNEIIHETRLLFFYGSRTSKRRQRENGGWPESRLQKIYDILRDFDIGFQSAAYLLQEASQAVYGVQGLLDMIGSEGGKELLEKRMEVIDMSRSVAKALIIDSETESFERKATTFTGVSDVLDRLAIRLAAAAEMPVTVLMGQSPAGLSATGDSDIRRFYDQVGVYRRDKIKPGLETIVRLLLLEQGAEPESWSVEFPSLYQQTETEIATTRLAVAQTDKLYFDMGALLPEEIAVNRFTAEGWNMETTIDLELRAEMLDHSQENALQQAKEPPPDPALLVAQAKVAADPMKADPTKGE